MQNIICFIVFVLLALGGFFIFGVKLPKKKNIVSISKATAKDKRKHVIEELFRVGFTDDELVDVFNFGKDDVSAVVDEIEEGD